MLIRFSAGTGFAGWVVRFATWSWCAHVGFKLDDGLVLDATPEFGVAIREAQDDASTRYFEVVGATPARLKTIEYEAVQWAIKQIGAPYDWTAIYGMAFRQDWHTSRNWFCSELVAGGFDYAGMPLVEDHGLLDRITPRDLLLSPLLREVGRS